MTALSFLEAARTVASEAPPSGPSAHPAGRLLREAVVAGVIGAATIAIWFLVLDAVKGRPLNTPTLLGTLLFQGGADVASPEALPISFPMVGLYTLVHGLAFCGIGYVAVRLFVAAERHPPLVFGLLLFFIIFFCGFIAVTAVVAEPALRALTIPAIVSGNFVAALLMGLYLWRHHPLDLRALMG